MNYLSIEKASLTNGKGVRVVLWVSGCSIHCRGCHNPESWDYNSGKIFDTQSEQELFDALSKPYIQGVTLSGGHPLEDANLEDVFSLVCEIRNRFPQKDIWLYTGLELNYKDFIYNPNMAEKNESEYNSNLRAGIICQCDVVVDGAYIESQRDTTLPFRGSENQRLIDVNETLKSKHIIHYHP